MAYFRHLLSGFFACSTICMLMGSCDAQTNSGTYDDQHMNLPYRFDSPDKIFVLPPELIEVSGLTLSEEERYLIAVQDEWGHFFKIDRESGALAAAFPFGKNGDYEGIEWVGETLYVVNSSGTLFGIAGAETDSQEVSDFQTFLTEDYDIEGLGYDKERHSLLLVCKEHPESHDDRFVFSFDLNSMKLQTEPIFRLNQDSIQALAPEKTRTFRPSGIARHPFSGDYYILSAASDRLLVMNSDGIPTHLVHLPKKRYNQPEGICFAQDGTLYISDEGNKNESGSIKVFFPKD